MIKIRKMKPSDLSAVAKLHVRSWQSAYRGIFPDTYLDSLDPRVLEERSRRGIAVNPDVIRLVALEKSVPVGLLVGLENRTPVLVPEARSEIWFLYVHPDHWGRGVGRALLREFLSLAEAPVVVWVLGKNLAGRKFYESLGGKLLDVTQDFDFEGKKYPEVAYLYRK